MPRGRDARSVPARPGRVRGTRTRRRGRLTRLLGVGLVLVGVLAAAAWQFDVVGGEGGSAAPATSTSSSTSTTFAPTTTTTTLIGNRFTNQLPAYINTGPTDKAQVAITIDDIFGPAQARQLAQVLDYAKDRGVHLTIFPTGGAVEEQTALGLQDVWHRAVLEGHEIGNHTYSHTAPTKLTDAQLRDEITRTQSLMDTALGPQFSYKERLFRPPGGAGGYSGGDPRIMSVLGSMGYSMAMWTIDSNGTAGFQSYVNKIVSQARNGSIILIHFATFSPENVATIIDRLRNERHLEPVTMSELYSS